MKITRVFAISLAPAVIAACGSSTEPEGGPPTLPPEASFVLSFDDFQSTPLNAGLLADAGMPGLTWGQAALTVGLWNTIITVTLAAPVASFVAAINQTPSWKDDHWEWKYDFQVGTQNHSARLEARVETDAVLWSMFISGPGYDDFNWYTGESQLDGSEALWRLDLGPNDRTPFVDITWINNATTGIRSIRYTNAIAGSNEQGGHILFTNEPVASYDRWYTVFSASQGKTTDIQWNATTKAGRINGPQSDGTTDWRCWDANLDDVACP